MRRARGQQAVNRQPPLADAPVGQHEDRIALAHRRLDLGAQGDQRGFQIGLLWVETTVDRRHPESGPVQAQQGAELALRQHGGTQNNPVGMLGA